jgi:magnesium-transporting ATPase (P-type)
MRQPLFKMAPLRQNKPLIWAVIAGLALVLFAFILPGLRNLLGIVPLSLQQWVVIALVALSLLAIVELAKWINRRFFTQ